IAVVPAKVIAYAVRDSRPWAEIYHLPWPNEPELMQFLSQNVSSQVGQPLRGSIKFLVANDATQATLANVWAHGMHAIDEYSQLVTPQAIYFLHAVVRSDVLASLNQFMSYPGDSWDTFARVMPLFGTRYYLTPYGRLPRFEELGYPFITLPRRAPGKDPGLWY